MDTEGMRASRRRPRLLDRLREALSEAGLIRVQQQADFREVFSHNPIDDYRDRCTIGFQSGTWCLPVDYEHGGEITISLGTMSTPFGGNDPAWVDLEYMLAYLEGKRIEWDIDHR